MKWNDICLRVNKHINISANEDRFQELFEHILLALGWSDDEIVVKKSFQVGAANRIMPDIIISKDNENTIVIELKRPILEPSQTHISQLTSYLRALGVRFGIYIGRNLQLYHNETSNAKDPQKVFETDFVKDNNDAQELINLLKKENFSKEGFEKFCVDMAEKNHKAKQEAEEKKVKSQEKRKIISKSRKGYISEGHFEVVYKIIKPILQKYINQILNKKRGISTIIIQEAKQSIIDNNINIKIVQDKNGLVFDENGTARDGHTNVFYMANVSFEWSVRHVVSIMQGKKITTAIKPEYPCYAKRSLNDFSNNKRAEENITLSIKLSDKYRVDF
ncbi:MAG: type I restriction enzyme HsdR N-terminal domain-containing protein [Campylobacteraceae bacterium]|jgi:hypothetical protein|nr:type I restriction enzyme HsdR N-terminal domain-containing protein [Campylobacteraceae bacterium]